MSIIDHFKKAYNQFSADSLELLDEVYAPDIQFQDPVKKLDGIEPLRAYLANLYSNVESCHFEYESTVVGQNEAYIRWVMHMKHRRFRPAETLSLPGVSHVHFDQLITHHRDFFDMGAMIYERVPVLGSVIGHIKRKL